MARNARSSGDDKNTTSSGEASKEKPPLETPESIKATDLEPVMVATADAQDEPTPEPEPEPERWEARLPYPHSQLIIPGGGAQRPDGTRPDLVIVRDWWVSIPPDQVQRVKDTARRASIKLMMRSPLTSQNREG